MEEDVVREASPEAVHADDDDHVDDNAENSEDGNENDAEEEDADVDRPMKESHLTFGVSTVIERSFETYKGKRYLMDPEHCRVEPQCQTQWKEILFPSDISCKVGFAFP